MFHQKILIFTILIVFIVSFNYCKKKEQQSEIKLVTSSGEEIKEIEKPIYTAIKNGDVDKLKKMIEGGLNVNSEAEEDNKPLLATAAQLGKIKVVQMLIDEGADVNGKNQYGWGVLAAINNYDTPAHFQIINLLLKNGANINIQDNDGNTPLHNCYRYNSVKFLVTKGANPTIKNKKGLTPLDVLKEIVNDKDSRIAVDPEAIDFLKNLSKNK